MELIKTATKTSLITLVALSFALLTPLPAFAEESTNKTAPNSATGTSADKTGQKKPPGPDGGTYKFNETTGLWENDHYTWDPATKQTKPKIAPDYSYNPSTGMWDTTTWTYDAAAGKYVENTKSVPPTASMPKPKAVATNEPIKTDDAASGPASEATPSSVAGTGSTQKTTNEDSNSGNFDLFYNADISNSIDSTATSGDASVTKNTTAGDATSGDALSMANVLNLLQTSWGTLHDEGFVSFVSNIFGDVVGDLTIDPNSLAQNSSSSNKVGDIDVNVAGSSTINNNINLTANSGNAAVNSNTTGGNATSGSATAMANVVNVINSVIGSGKSFFGLVNIHGNLDGDILMPQEFLSNLLASNAPSATLDTSKLSNQDTLANFTNNQSITNNTSTTAKSGNAEVSKNTSAGNATTGKASTNLTVFNLTGKNIVGKDSLLVFVNVLGQWMGMIVNAPNSTAAALGDGTSTITGASPSGGDGNTTINSTADSAINNNITVAASSGDAKVTNNTQAGNATSGDASASINLANINNSSLSLTNWFGILFINIFGNWNGSFGIDTPNGNPTFAPASSNRTTSPTTSQTPQVFRFVSHNGTYTAESVEYTPAVQQQVAAATTVNDTPQTDNRVLGAVNNSTDNGPLSSSASTNWWLPIVGSILGALLIGAERVLAITQKRRVTSKI